MAGNFSWVSTVAFSFDLTWLVLAIGIPHHGPRADFGSHDGDKPKKNIFFGL